MALIQRTNPIDLDAVISRFQTKLFDHFGIAEYACFDRVYNNPKTDSGSMPETYTLNGDYEDTLYNDRVPMSSFFIDDPIRKELEDYSIEVKTSLIFQVDLDKVKQTLFTTTSHRPDEEFNNFVIAFIQDYCRKFNHELRVDKSSIMERTIDKVYREFDRKQIRFDSMSAKYAVRFNFIAQYDPFKGSFCD